MARISVVVPVYDEQDSLEALHRELDAALAGESDAIELIFVDDGSRDESLARLRALSAKDPRVRVLALDRNHGQSAALDAGFRAARGEIVVMLDGDGQNDPADIPRLLAELTNADVVNGVRVDRRDPFLRRASSRVANAVRNGLTRETITDVGCSLRAMRAEPLRRVRMWSGAHRFLPTLLRLEGARIVEIPVSHRPRRHGRSKYGIANRLFAGLVDVCAVRWWQARTLRYGVREERAGGSAPLD
ncbi:glycosyltransferase family 2 protein [Myxococcota bacterium]|nr:glycosyltransferase family 2 protein [Myxococcota bacterium]MCZ7620485.1 glycosyltransferase family 2 protein [Myxococcota bacterium]